MTAAVTPITQATIDAQLQVLSDQGLDAVRTGDLSGSVAVRCNKQPALLINTRADVSVLAGAAFALAQRLKSFLEVMSMAAGGTELDEAVDAAFSMASEVAALTDVVANHPTVMRSSSAGAQS